MEEFVSFELAKKLKEKGFREKCLTYYDVEDNVGLLYNTKYSDDILPCQYTDLLASHNANEVTLPDDSENCVDAPTISQVLKWLREKKGLHIEVRFDSRGFGACIDKYDLKNLEHISFNPLLYHGFFKTYEEAALDGIEYVLDNLI